MLCPFMHLNGDGVRSLAQKFDSLSFVSAEGAMPAVVPLDAPVIWISTLRQPMDRLISAYHWWREQAWARPSLLVCHGYAATTRNADTRALRWLELVPDNFMARSFCGGPRAWSQSIGGKRHGLSAPNSLFDCALRRLRLFAVVTVAELPEVSARVLAARLGWRHFKFITGSERANVRNTNVSLDGPSMAEGRWLRAHANSTLIADQRLYEEAVLRLIADDSHM